MLQYRLARAVDRPIPGLAGFSVRISDDLRKCVVFLGVHDDTPGKGGIHCAGTGFLLLYKKDAYLITAKHVAKEFDDGPFLVRVNKSGGGSDNLHGDQIRWFYHSNDDVDAAALPFFLSPRLGYESKYIPEDMIVTEDVMNSESIGIGDTCYTVGLFRPMAGERRNLPAVHSGNIALLPGDEKIPIKDWDDPRRRRHVEGYLVESQSLRGLSGSPVFVRPVIDFLDLPVEFGGKLEQTAVRLQKRDLLLLGLWIGAWDAPPDEVMAVDRGDQTRVPVGMGTVVPASKIIEVLEVPELIERRRLLEEQRATSAASLDATGVAHSGGNPSEGVEG